MTRARVTQVTPREMWLRPFTPQPLPSVRRRRSRILTALTLVAFGIAIGVVGVAWLATQPDPVAQHVRAERSTALNPM